jgi:hypothetical protein
VTAIRLARACTRLRARTIAAASRSIGSENGCFSAIGWRFALVIDALSTIVHKPSAYNRGNIIVEKLKDIIPRQQF